MTGLRYTCTSYERRTPQSEAHRQMVYGPIESDLPPLRPVWEFVGGAFVIALVCGVLFGFALVTP